MRETDITHLYESPYKFEQVTSKLADYIQKNYMISVSETGNGHEFSEIKKVLSIDDDFGMYGGALDA